MTAILREFRAFLLRGNILELAIAFVIGVAFAALVNSFVNNILMQIVAGIFGKPDFSDLSFSFGDAEIYYGAFINSLIAFVSIAAALFFLVVKPVSVFMERVKRNEEEAPEPAEEVALLREIRDLLRARQP